MTAAVSVVIPTFNRLDSLARCVEALPPEVEVVVVDDGSTDGTARRIRSLVRPRLTYIRRPRNFGPAAARNVGIQRASGDFIAFTDDDCVPSGGWPFPLVEELEQSSDAIAGVGGRILPLRDSTVARFCTFHGILEPPRSLAYLVTANCAYRRGAILEAGGFDERIPFAGGEDPGLSARVRALGHSLGFAPRAIVYHDYRPGWLDFARTFYRYGHGCALSALSGPESPSTSRQTPRSDLEGSGYRGYSLGFPADDLVPPKLTPSNVIRELSRTLREYEHRAVSRSDRVSFLALKLTQRVAYNYGWSQGEQKGDGSLTRRTRGRDGQAGRDATQSGTSGYAGTSTSTGEPSTPPIRGGQEMGETGTEDAELEGAVIKYLAQAGADNTPIWVLYRALGVQSRYPPRSLEQFQNLLDSMVKRHLILTDRVYRVQRYV